MTRFFSFIVRLINIIFWKNAANKLITVLWRRKVRTACVAIADIQMALNDLGMNRGQKRKFWAWFRRNPEACWDFLARHYTK